MNHTPTRGGNWHVINGDLVDVDQVPPHQTKPQSPINNEKPAAPQRGRRHRKQR